MACFAWGAVLVAVPGGWDGIGPAAAQQRVSVAADFRGALEPYGAWHHNRRFGEVWVPASRRVNWRPYTVGHWVYTETYGWYWVEDIEEADWGWITYHYGRWYLDPDDGWIWIMGDEWSPGWVDWRYGEQVIGWAPLAPAGVAVEVEERPEFWAFARGRDFVAPRLDRVLLAPQEARNDFQRTALVNRPVELRDRHFAVNPGIPAAFAAAAVGRPLQAFNVRPRVFAGTTNVPGAMQISAEDLRRQRELSNRPGRPGARIGAQQTVLQPTGTLVSPVAGRSLPPPRPLARGEPGRLGDTPPRAARGPAAPTTEGRAPPQPFAQPPQQPNAQPPSGNRQGSASPGNRPRNAPLPGEQRAAPSPPARAVPPAAATREPPAIRRGAVEPRIGERRETAPQRVPSGPEQRPLGRVPTEQAPAVAAPQRQAPPASIAPQRQAAPGAPQRQAAPVAPRPSAPPAAAAPRPVAPPAAAARPQGPSTTGAAPGGGRGPQRRQ
jgi:hypothetical protein